MDERIKVGTKVFLDGNRDLLRSSYVREGTISKVGRKYFEVTVTTGTTVGTPQAQAQTVAVTTPILKNVT